MPFFSIIIPAYNRAYILPETLASIVNQSFLDWEIIVVDDGSTDNTKEVIENISKNNPKLNYIFQKNAERSAARNNGAKYAKGKYLLFLDSDDFYKPNHLENIHSSILLEKEPIALFFTNVIYLNQDIEEKPEIPVMKKGYEFEYLLLNPITPSRVCIHYKIFDDFKFDPEIVIVEDLVLWVNIATKFPVCQVNSYTLMYRIHGGNSVDLSKNSYLSRYKGLKRLFNHPIYKQTSDQIPNKIKKFLLAECSFNMARHYEFIKKNKMMVKMLLLSFIYKFNYRNKERLYMILSKF
jgi:glycosyltransferase involved in cell wall biosynthesis